MNQNNRISFGIISGIVIIVFPLWYLSYPETTFRHNFKPFFIYTSQLAALTGFSLFAIALVLSTRIKWMENLMGGLDKVYHTHHTLGKIAFYLLLSHPVLLTLRWIPGQFCFFSFQDDEISREAHPFTICSTSDEDEIRIIVKTLGGFTKGLYDNLQPEVPVLVEGPYGGFDYQIAPQPQVWIAGGVGIAPFISWARELKYKGKLKYGADLYYCVNHREDAHHLGEFRELEQSLTGFKVHLICADKEGFLSAAKIPAIDQKPIFICGPKAMRQALFREFRQLKVPEANIRFEDFDFF